jgi:hypothetical protein
VRNGIERKGLDPTVRAIIDESVAKSGIAMPELHPELTGPVAAARLIDLRGEGAQSPVSIRPAPKVEQPAVVEAPVREPVAFEAPPPGYPDFAPFVNAFEYQLELALIMVWPHSDDEDATDGFSLVPSRVPYRIGE